MTIDADYYIGNRTRGRSETDETGVYYIPPLEVSEGKIPISIWIIIFING